MKRKIFDGTEMVEVEVPDVRRPFDLAAVCPPDSECLRARLEVIGKLPNEDCRLPIKEARRRPVQLALISRRFV